MIPLNQLAPERPVYRAPLSVMVLDATKAEIMDLAQSTGLGLSIVLRWLLDAGLEVARAQAAAQPPEGQDTRLEGLLRLESEG